MCEASVSELIERARKAQQDHEQKHDVQLELVEMEKSNCPLCETPVPLGMTHICPKGAFRFTPR